MPEYEEYESDDSVNEAVAIIGMSGRFPGARDLDEFWQNLLQGVDSIEPLTDQQLLEAGHDPAEVRKDPSFVAAGATLGDTDLFDADLFGYNPQEATLLDPQHRLLLSISWKALESAGYDSAQTGASIGVYVGKAKNSYLTRYLLPNRKQIAGSEDLLMVLGNESDYLSTSISYRLGLNGPSVNVHTACSTSLVAVHHAKQSLLNYECDMALAGGVCVRLPEGEGYEFNEGNILSSDGHTRTFDADASGTIFGNGAGIVVLKRLSEALTDEDNILAVLKGSAINNDGPVRQGFMAPSVDGQARVIQMALADAEVSAREVTYVEGHGTATPLGDPIEVAALSQAYEQETGDRQYCALGSVKSNIGHLDAAAGVSGLIKTVLSLHHKAIPASINCDTVNPKFQMENTPFFVNQATRDWVAGPGGIRYAGVSSFGAGGTNAHVILQEAPETRNVQATARPYSLLVWSGKDEKAAQQNGENLLQFVTQDIPQTQRLADIVYTLQTGRRGFEFRQFAGIGSVETLQNTLQNRNKIKPARIPDEKPSIIFMFPGQGSQYPGMAATLYRHEPEFRRAFDRCIEILKPLLPVDLEGILYTERECVGACAEMLNQTHLTQPALFAIEYSLAQWWMTMGVKPAAMIGHSVGEYVAACLAGVFSLKDALTLVAKRGELIQSLPSGAMLAVTESAERIADLLPENLSVSSINTTESCVVAGNREDIERFVEVLQQQDIDCRVLKTSHAFHSSHMDPILDQFEAEARNCSPGTVGIPFISGVTGQWIRDEQASDAAYWASHIRQPVRFSDGRTSLEDQYPGGLFLEVGPGNTLCSLMRAAGTNPDSVISSLGHPLDHANEPVNLMNALGALWAAGLEIDWESYYRRESRRRTQLPVYAMQLKRYWIDKAPVLSMADLVEPGSATLQVSKGADIAIQAGAGNTTMQLDTVRVIDIGSSPGQELKAITRQEHLIIEIRKILCEISGMEQAALEDNTTFIQLGFDSLFLTQASNAIRKTFKTRVTFRQLLETTATISDLAAFLDQQLDPGVFQPPVPETAMALTADNIIQGGENFSAITFAGNTSDGDWRQQLAQQISSLSRQIEQIGGMLGGLPATDAAPAVMATASVAEKLTVSSVDSIPEKHGPWKQISRKADDSLNEKQRAALAELVAAYVAKTGKSKDHAQHHRVHFADPRGISSFDRIWKELVYPLVTVRSSGSRMWDLDGNEYIDIQSGFGSVFFGHNMPFIKDSIVTQLESGMQIGPQSAMAGEVAKAICEITGMERVTFCNTGSEAVLAAMRISRTVTGNDKIVMFAQDYHGIFDEVVSRRSGSMESLRSLPAAPGIPPEAVENIVILDYGDDDCFEILDSIADDLAAVLIEPVQSRRPDFQPVEFLRKLREWTRKNSVVYIFDEVITGFRLHPRGAQGWYGIDADLCAYGKVVGGGMPAGILAGDRKYMDALDGGMWQYGDDSIPEVGVTYFAGTFVRHPLTVAAAHAAVTRIQSSGDSIYKELNEKSSRLANEINQCFRSLGAPITLQHCGSMFAVQFLGDSRFNPLFYCYLRMLGVHILEGGTFFLSLAHTHEEVTQLVSSFEKAARWMMDNSLHEALAGTDSNIGQPLQITSIKTGEASPELQLALTRNQQELWLASQMGESASCAYNLSNTLMLRGPLDTGKLYESLLGLVNLHESLRLTCTSDGFARIASSISELDYRYEDLSGLGERERSEAVDRAAVEAVTTPYDLQQGPLIRFNLFKLTNEKHLLFVNNHHLASDGWSNSLLLEQLGNLYSGREAVPGDEILQFSDYAKWLGELEQQERHKQDKSFWLAVHETQAEPLELPMNGKRPLLKTYTARCARLAANEGTVRRVQELAQVQGVTTYHLLLAVFQSVLHKLSGQSDITIGIPVAGQLSAPEPNLIGHCVNFAVLRSSVTPYTPLTTMLQDTRNRVLDAFEHAFFGYGELVNALKIQGDSSRNPLVSVVFNVDIANLDIDFSGLQTTLGGNDRRFEIFDLFVDVIVEGEQLTYTCTYNTDLYDGETIERWLRYYQFVLETFLKDINLEFAALPGNTSEDEQKLMSEWSGSASLPAPCHCIHDLMRSAVANTPDKSAVLSGRETAGVSTYSYIELDKESNRIAHYLREQGAAPGKRVALSVNRTPDMLAWLLGILKTGAAYIPLDAEFPASRIEFMLRDAKPSLLVVDQNLVQHIPVESLGDLEMKVVVTGMARSSLAEISSDDPHFAVNPGDTAYIIYTSGSTGKPKGVMVSHGAVVNLIASLVDLLNLSESDRLLAVTTLSFDIAALELYAMLYTGGIVVIADSADTHDGQRLAELLDQQAVTLLQATPATWRMLLDTGSSLKFNIKALCGGEALSRDLATALLPSVNELWNMYGPTETTIWSSIYRVLPDTEEILIGRPIHNTRVYVLDERANPVPIGASGELYIGGDGLADGYFERAELTESRFVKNPLTAEPGARLYRTGDRVRFKANGEIKYLGRLDRQVKLRGHRIELGEIEVALRQHAQIRDCAVVITEREQGDVRLVAYILWKQNALTLTDVRSHLRSWVPDYMIPQLLVELDELPRTLNGKLDVNALPDAYGAMVDETRNVAPETAEELWVADQWKEIIGINTVGLYDNFFDLGGHSLLAIRFINKVHLQYGATLHLRDVILETLHHIASAIAEPESGQPETPTPALKPANQRRLFGRLFGNA